MRCGTSQGYAAFGNVTIMSPSPGTRPRMTVGRARSPQVFGRCPRSDREPSRRQKRLLRVGLGRAHMWFIRVGAMCTLALAAVAVAAEPAVAGGSWLAPVRDRYEPGDVVTFVGYVGPGGTLGSIEDGPFFAYLRRLDAAVQSPTNVPIAPFAPQPSDLRLGQLVVEHTGRADYAAYRVSIQFPLPGDLPAGRYGVSYCNATCTKGLSDLIGGVVFVGRDPDGPIIRPAEPPPASTMVTSAPVTTTLPAADTERTVRRASDSSPGERGSAGWALPVLLIAAALSTMVIALFIRALPKG
jgi:hypothetical protein